MRIPAWKSLLFAPADNEAIVAKAINSSADAVILDLEDGVAAANKAKARAMLSAAAERLRVSGRGVAVRVNASLGVEDRNACVAAMPDVIVLPKSEAGEEIEAAASALGENGIGILALIESAAAVENLATIARHPRVVGLALGTEDFSVSLGVAPTADSLDLPAKLVALAAAPRRLMALAAPISIAAFRDKDAYAAALSYASRFGATGAICIHPSQVDAANATFQPTEAQCTQAKAVLEAWRAAKEAGKGVISLDGRMIDAPVVAQARQTLARAGQT